MTIAAAVTPPPAIDWEEVGRLDYWAGKRMPHRITRLYPTQDRYLPEDEALFLVGWRKAEATDRLARETVTRHADD